MCGGGGRGGGPGLRLDRACILIGALHFLVSAGVFSTAVVFLVTTWGDPLQAPGGPLQAPGGPLQALGGPVQAAPTLRALRCALWAALVVSLASMLFAAALLLGVKLRAPGLVLCFVGWGLFAALGCPPAALLLALRGHWAPPLPLLVACLWHARCALSAHALHEALHKGRQFGFSAHQPLPAGEGEGEGGGGGGGEGEGDGGQQEP